MSDRFDAIKVKDQLGYPEEVGFYPLDKSSNLVFEHVVQKLQTRVVTGDTIWGSGTWSDSAVWDGSYDGVVSDLYIISPFNRFVERFWTQDFCATGTTSAIVNTGLGTVTIASGQVYDSTTIYKGTSNVISATVYATATGGDVTYQVSADNKATYATCPVGVQTAFSASASPYQGAVLSYKATCTSGTATVSFIKVTYTPSS